MSDFCRKVRELLMIFERCWGVPKSRYSVFSGFTERRLEVSQEKTSSRMEDRLSRPVLDSVLEKEVYSWVSSAYK